MMDPKMLDEDDRDELIRLLEDTAHLCASSRENDVAEAFQSVATALREDKPWMHVWAEFTPSVVLRLKKRDSSFGMRDVHGPFESAHARLTQQAVGTVMQVLRHVPAEWPACLKPKLITEV
jgi:hypothetical protein